MQEVDDDPLAKYRRPGSKAPVKEFLVSSSGIKLREYKAFTSDSSRSPLLLLKPGLVKKPVADLALPYSLTRVVSDGFGFCFTLTFAVPFPSGPVIVAFAGEGMTPVLDAILRGVATQVQVFDPEKFIPPAPGDWDKLAHEWRGPAVVKEITITDKNTPTENESTTKH
jgi:hypothetical protein